MSAPDEPWAGQGPKITAVEIAEVRVSLPRVLRLGTTAIITRDFVALRLKTDAGVTGEALGYVRGTPLARALEMLAPRLVGQDALRRGAIVGGLSDGNIPGRAAFTRAVSLIDIACWDILAKLARLPLHRLLGGLREAVPATAVAGYYMDVRPTAEIADEAARRLDEGYARVKIMLKGDDAAFDLAYIDAVAARAPGRLAADAHWSWATLTDAARFCRRLPPDALQFLEDPFAAADWPLCGELRQLCPAPLAMGEDLYGARAIAGAAAVVDVLRVDATTCGGITGAIEAITLGTAAGRNVFPHVFAPLHAHLACAFPNVEGVEVIPAETGADPLERVLRAQPALVDGLMRPSDAPGVGVDLDWEAIGRDAAFAATIGG